MPNNNNSVRNDYQKINSDYTYLLIGDVGVGKTSFGHVLAKGEKPKSDNDKSSDYFAFLEVDSSPYRVHLINPLDAKDQLQPDFFSEDIDVALLCFSLTDPTSLVNLKNKWYPILKKQLPNVPVILIGLKGNLVNQLVFEQRGEQVKENDIKDIEKQTKAIGYFKYHSLQKTEVDSIFSEIIRCTIKHYNLPYKMLQSLMESGKKYSRKRNDTKDDAHFSMPVKKLQEFINGNLKFNNIIVLLKLMILIIQNKSNKNLKGVFKVLANLPDESLFDELGIVTDSNFSDKIKLLEDLLSSKQFIHYMASLLIISEHIRQIEKYISRKIGKSVESAFKESKIKSVLNYR